jgi:hypothetical protein
MSWSFLVALVLVVLGSAFAGYWIGQTVFAHHVRAMLMNLESTTRVKAGSTNPAAMVELPGIQAANRALTVWLNK